MKIGTKSILFGAHQFLIHPIFLFIAWWQLFGFPRDPRLWVAFVVHDLGYLGKPNMDGPEGETHPELGAKLMRFLFDWNFWLTLETRTVDATGIWKRTRTLLHFETVCWLNDGQSWHDFTLYHSRFMARKRGAKFSPLCVADKLATCLMPAWLYLFLVNLTGEVHEYMDAAQAKEGGRYANEGRRKAIAEGDQLAWRNNMVGYMREWIEEHRDGRDDTWTPSL